MKTLRSILGAFSLGLCLILLAWPGQAADKIRVLVVTGGHDFEREPFMQMFKDNAEITFQAVEHPQAQAWFKADAAAKYDVLVFYDMYQKIDEEAKANLVSRLKEGKGLVALHHGLGSYGDWDEYTKIMGGRFHLKERVVSGVKTPGSTYKHDVQFRVHVADPNHPVTRGVKDFDILDETYGGLEVRPGVHTLLTTKEPTSSPTICWAHTYEAARVLTLQLGHDHKAYENPSFRQLLTQAIRWTAKRD
jgi:type 1 glutamine amidotransferase